MQIANTSVAAIYTVPATDWQAIKRRISSVLIYGGWPISVIEGENFPSLIAACQQWQTFTLPGLVSQSRLLADYAAHAQHVFTPLATVVATLDQNGALPPNLANLLQTALTDLSQRTTIVSNDCQALVAALNTFYQVNMVVDQQLSVVRWDECAIALMIDGREAGLPPGAVMGGSTVQSIESQAQAVNTAASRLLGDWGAIANNLQQVVSGQVELTLAILTELDLQSALLAWQTIESQAVGFQQCFARVCGQ